MEDSQISDLARENKKKKKEGKEVVKLFKVTGGRHVKDHSKDDLVINPEGKSREGHWGGQGLILSISGQEILEKAVILIGIQTDVRERELGEDGELPLLLCNCLLSDALHLE